MAGLIGGNTYYLTKSKKRTLFMVVFSLYIYFVGLITLFSRFSNPMIHTVTLTPFGTISGSYRSKKWAIENIILFIPFGIYLKILFKEKVKLRHAVLLGALVSLLIETTQLVTGRGNFEVDDIITNALGSAIGFIAWLLVKRWQSYRAGKYKEDKL